MTVRKLPGPPPCQFCGKVPACVAWTCARLRSVTVDESGWSVEFWPESVTSETTNDETDRT